MKTYKIFGLSFALLIFNLMTGLAANTVSLSAVSGASGEEVTVSVSLNNSDAVSSIQLSIPMEGDYTFVAGSQKASSRLGNHSVTAGMKDEVLNIIIYSMSMAAISGNDGDLLTFKLRLGTTPGLVNLTPSSLKLTGMNGSQLSGTTVAGSVETKCAKAQFFPSTLDFGRVSINGCEQANVSINNIGNEPLIITAIGFTNAIYSLTDTELPMTIEPGNWGYVSVKCSPTNHSNATAQMLITSNSVAQQSSLKLTAEPYSENSLTIGNASGYADEEKTVSISMHNTDEIIGFQLEFELPEGLEYVDGSFLLSARKQNHAVGASINEGILRIVGYSPTGKAVTGNDGELASLKLRLKGQSGNYELRPYKAILTAVIDNKTEDVLSNIYSGYVSISSPQLWVPSELDFGNVSATGEIEKILRIENNGIIPLTVSKIEFDDDQYGIKDSLPFTVNSYDSKTITIIRTDKTEGAFSTNMKIHSNDPESPVKLVTIKGTTLSPNYLTIKADNSIRGSTMKLHITVENNDPISGMQFDFTLPEGIIANNENVDLTSRASGMTTTINDLGDNQYRFIGYTMGNAIATGNDEIMELSLQPSTNLEFGNYEIRISNIKLGTKDMKNKYAGEETLTVPFSVLDLLGDVNKDGRITVTDVTKVIDMVLNGTFDPIADVNIDGRVTVTDVTKIIDMVLNNP